MKRDKIETVEIDEDGRLHVVPATHSFPHVYREAMEIQWDQDRGSLYSPMPREWSTLRWLKQILEAAKAQGCELHFAPDTRWINVDPCLENQIALENQR